MRQTIAITSLFTVMASLHATAQEAELSQVQVTANGQQTVADTQLEGKKLDQIKSTNLGDTLAQLPGVQNASMGQAVGRPVIRGLDGARVKIAENSLSTKDASSMSQDHAVSIEPFLADRIEILKGAKSFEYGSGHTGGVVNVDNGRIATQLPNEPLSGRFESRIDSVSKGHTQALRMDAARNNLVLHVDGLYRNHQDYRTPLGRLQNSDLQTKNGAVGLSLVDDWGYLGASASRYLNDYGVPAEEGVTIPMQQTRYEVKSRLWQPYAQLSALQAIEIDYAHTDYHHQEIEEGDVESDFSNQTNELRLQFVHAPLAGWEGKIGAHWSNEHFAALGEETFVPKTQTQTQALFWYEKAQWDRLTVDLGARIDQHKKQAEGMPEKRFRPVSVAAGFTWSLRELWDLSLELERNQRAPGDEELYANGPHHASHTYEVGNPNLSEESANQIELGLHFNNYAIEASVAVYANQYQDFIYLADTQRPDIDGMPQRDWQQQNALFRGAEVQATFFLTESAHGRWSLNTYSDYVRATFKDNTNVPRIPAARLGANLQWQSDHWYFDIGSVQYFKQSDIAEQGTDSASYNLISTHLNWTPVISQKQNIELYLEGNNLTDQTIRPATSLFKDEVPLPGRNVAAGIRWQF